VVVQSSDEASNIINSTDLTIYVDITVPRVRLNSLPADS